MPLKWGRVLRAGSRDILIENNEVWETGISGLALELVDGGIMDHITVRQLVINGAGTAIFLRLGDRNHPSTGSDIAKAGILRNVLISGVKAFIHKPAKFNDAERSHHNYDVYACSICGIPGFEISNVTLDDIVIEMQGGFPEALSIDALREIPEVGSKYPENRMFGLLPAWGLYIRHARGMDVKNVQLINHQKDGRPAFVLDDVHHSSFRSIRISSSLPAPAFSVEPNCSGINLYQ